MMSFEARTAVNPVRARLLWPLTFALTMLLAINAAWLWQQQERRLREAIGARMDAVEDQMRAVLAQQHDTMGTLLEIITADPGLQSALQARDRENLLARHAPLFAALSRDHGITEMQFHDVQRDNVLRVRVPHLSGGHIDHRTLREAERTRRTAGGLEIESSGAFVLRAVRPVFKGGSLVGYAQLGKDMDKAVRGLQVDGSVQFALTLHKANLKRDEWRETMRRAGRETDWERYPDDVVNYSSLQPPPYALLDTHLRDYDSHDHGRLDLDARSGGRVWRVAFMPFADASGRDIGDMIVMLDVTDRQAAFARTLQRAGGIGLVVLVVLLAFLDRLLTSVDRRLLEQQAALQRTGGVLRAIFDTAVDGIVVTDERGRIELFNPAAERIFGYSAQQAVGSNVSMLMPDAERRAHDGYIRRYLETEEARVVGNRRDMQGRRRDGELFPLELAVAETRVEGRRLFTGLVRDISARKQAERELIEAHAAAERASRAKSEFLSSMSHELRTPMNAVLGFAQLLEYDATLSAQQRDSVNEIIRAGHHLLDLINEVLDLAKIETGHIELALEPVEIGERVRECFNLLRPMADARGVRLRYDDLRSAVVCADRVRFKQVLLNLLANAVKYNRERGDVEVAVETLNNGYARISVTDSGLGIPDDRLDELFQPFSRLGAEAGGVEGTGIGLTITRRLVERMGGAIGVESRPGSGSRFWIDLPLDTRVPAPL